MSNLERINAAITSGELKAPLILKRPYDSEHRYQTYKIWRENRSLFWQLSYATIKPSGRMSISPSETHTCSFSSDEELTQELARKLMVRLSQGFTEGLPTPTISNNVKAVTLEEQLLNLQECGTTLAPKVTIAHLLQMEEREELEALPYDSVLGFLAAPPDWPSRRYLSPQLLYLDQECIYQRGDYTQVLKQFIRVTEGEVKISALKETFNSDLGVVSLSFLASGQLINWEFTLNDDWLDSRFFEKIAELACA